MNILYNNINANFRVVLDYGMDYNHAKKIVARLAGRAIVAILKDGDDHIKIEYIEYGLRNRMRFTKVMAEATDLDFFYIT